MAKTKLYNLKYQPDGVTYPSYLSPYMIFLLLKYQSTVGRGFPRSWREILTGLPSIL